MFKHNFDSIAVSRFNYSDLLNLKILQIKIQRIVDNYKSDNKLFTIMDFDRYNALLKHLNSIITCLESFYTPTSVLYRRYPELY